MDITKQALYTEKQRVNVKCWLRILRSANLVKRMLNARFRSHFGVNISRFDLLAALYKHHDGLTMTQVSRELMVTNGNVTMLISDLEKRELVTKWIKPQDRRTAYLRLTEIGRQRFEEMAKQHAQWVEEIFHMLDDSDKHAIACNLTQLIEHYSPE